MKNTQDINAANGSLHRLVRRIFPAPWWALLIFGSCALCIAMGNYLAAFWAFTAGAWCQARYEDSPNDEADRSRA